MSRSLSTSLNTLLEGTASREGVQSAVYDVLDRSGETNLLVLSYSDGPDPWLQNWRTHVGDIPSEVGFVHVGVKTRSAATLGTASRDPTPPGLPLAPDAVSDPSDLARLGIYASEYLESWADNGRQTVVYLDSLTELLEHVDSERAFRFLHYLTARVESVDGRGYYLIDPSAHDHHSLTVVRELVDEVVELDGSRSE